MMKAFSLWQPWASAMAMGAKNNETRSWFMSYRGDLVICAAKRKPVVTEFEDAGLYQQALEVPYGAALCVVEVYDCKPSDQFRQIQKLDYRAMPRDPKHIYITQGEWELGDYTPGRWITLTRNLRKLREPVPVVGRQGLFNLPPDVEAKVRAQL